VPRSARPWGLGVFGWRLENGRSIVRGAGPATLWTLQNREFQGYGVCQRASGYPWILGATHTVSRIKQIRTAARILRIRSTGSVKVRAEETTWNLLLRCGWLDFHVHVLAAPV